MKLAGIADTVFERIPDQIVSSQTLNVDAVSGASVTSRGILKKRPKPSRKMLCGQKCCA